MKHTSNDLRVRRTLKSIRLAFYEMVLTHNYEDISITELAERATINRKTFYLHLLSKKLNLSSWIFNLFITFVPQNG